MRHARFFVERPLARHTEIELPAPAAHHAQRVLRLRDGAAIVLFDGSGGEYAARLALRAGRAWAEITGFDAIDRESALDLRLVQAWLATDKLDWVVEKAVELGVRSIVLAPAQRSVVKLGADRRERRLQHLRAVVASACAQCGRNRLPSLTASDSLAIALQTSTADGIPGALLAPAADLALTAADFGKPAACALAIGPEGGFDDSEIARAVELGYRSYALGPRILRAETAGIAAIAALQALHGDLGIQQRE